MEKCLQKIILANGTVHLKYFMTITTCFYGLYS